MKKYPRKLIVKRKNVMRVVGRLSLDCDMAGFFTGGYDGYKCDSGMGAFVVFYLQKRNWWCPWCQEWVKGEKVTHTEHHETCGTYIGRIALAMNC